MFGVNNKSLMILLWVNSEYLLDIIADKLYFDISYHLLKIKLKKIDTEKKTMKPVSEIPELLRHSNILTRGAFQLEGAKWCKILK